MNQETSQYSLNFCEKHFTRYGEKLKLVTGQQLPDPYILKEKGNFFQSLGNDMEGCCKVFTRHTQCFHKEVH